MAEHDEPVQANALLVDPDSMTVVWMNESAARNLPGGDDLAGESGLSRAGTIEVARTRERGTRR